MKRTQIQKMLLTILFVVVCIFYLMPIFIVLMNSFKTNSSINTSTFQFPNEKTFTGTYNYVNGMTFGEYPFLKSAGYSLHHHRLRRADSHLHLDGRVVYLTRQ